MERESFIFYRSFYDSIKGLGDAEFAECMRFLCEYGRFILFVRISLQH